MKPQIVYFDFINRDHSMEITIRFSCCDFAVSNRHRLTLLVSDNDV